MSDFIKKQQSNAQLFGGSVSYIEELYEDYLTDPTLAPDELRTYFDSLQIAGQTDRPHLPIIDAYRNIDRNRPTSEGTQSAIAAEKQAGVSKLVHAYRVRGHQVATLDPLGLSHRPQINDLELSTHSLSEADLDHEFNTGSLAAPDLMKLRDIISLCNDVYCRNIGAEYMHITNTEERRWIQKRLEGGRGHGNYNASKKKKLLEALIAAEGLEKYLHTKYVGQKRFSLEGSDCLIPALRELFQHIGGKGIKECVIGMAHRGRLNVLVNLLGKSPRILFEEFEGKHVTENSGSGDVKYHLGYSSDIDTPGGQLHLAMSFNPSHLEIIDPVVIGSVRARQNRRTDTHHESVVGILIHGDAAFAGQGVIMETFQLSQARGFATGGTMHIIINNQIGFTTSNPLDARSTLYCTEVAKMVQAPIFHVNGDDPEAVVFCTVIAEDFRDTFKKDVVIDLVTYRRHGHNEADEPSATQPLMYKNIRSRKTPREIYQQKLIGDQLITHAGASTMIADYRSALDEGHPVTEIIDNPKADEYAVDWKPFLNIDWSQAVNTQLTSEEIQRLGNNLCTLPNGFTLHSRVQQIVNNRKKMVDGELSIDWGFAELMAYSSILDKGEQIRLVGQDCQRGTFFHRHVVLNDQNTGATFCPLDELSDGDDFYAINSLLSEEAVLGFEYGYSTADPNAMVIWEAQFGDFANGAQVVIDQFISSGETKWGRFCGLVLLLPHGFEGQGPEHSSARLERYLQLCAEHNMQVCMPTTPAQMFHMLRRQMCRNFRKPLIVMTPKSLLRNKMSTSELSCLENGHFHELIPEQEEFDDSKITRVVCCSGKVYYDIVSKRAERKLRNVALIRIEQLYPFPRDELTEQLKRYPNAKEVVWAQEEPMNQGAFYQIKHQLHSCERPDQHILYAGRARSASPAVGNFKVHVLQQSTLVDDALTPGKGIALEVE